MISGCRGMRVCGRLVVVNLRGRTFRGFVRRGAHVVFRVFASTKNVVAFFINSFARHDFLRGLKRMAFPASICRSLAFAFRHCVVDVFLYFASTLSSSQPYF